MTAITTAKERPEKIPGHPSVSVSMKMYTQKIPRGAIVMADANGYARNAAALASNKGCAGLATETVDNSAGSSGDKSIIVKSGRFLMTGSGFAQTDVGKKAYASDNDTISTTQGSNEPAVGVIDQFISSTQVYVEIGPLSVVNGL